MTDTLGDRIRAKRQQRVDGGAPARAVVLAAAKTYADNLRDVLKTYVDNQITQAKAAVLATAKTYVDNQLAAKIAKLAADNNLIND